MSVLEILEAHDYTIVEERFESHGKIQTIVCGCGDRYGFFVTHQKHVAQVLDQHMREREAEAWKTGVTTALNHAIQNPDGITLRLEHLDGRPWTNPYKEEQ